MEEGQVDESVTTEEYGRLLAVLRDTRRARGLSQADVAARLDVAQSWVSKIELGQRRLDVIQLAAVAHALDTRLSEVLSRAGID